MVVVGGIWESNAVVRLWLYRTYTKAGCDRWCDRLDVVQSERPVTGVGFVPNSNTAWSAV